MSTQSKALEKAKEVKTLPNANNVKPAEEAKKAQILETIEKFKPEPFKTAEERILRTKHFEALANRYEQLKTKDNELKMFHAGNDKTSAKIIFKNTQGFEFTIQNTNVIERLTSEAQKELSVLLEEAKNEVLTFEI